MSAFQTGSLASIGNQISNAAPAINRQRSNQTREQQLAQQQPRRRTRMRQVIDQQLLDAGIDPNQARTNIDQQRRQILDARQERVNLAQRRRELERAGRVDEAEAVRQQIRSLRIGEDNALYGADGQQGFADQIRLTRPSLSRLPADEQAALRTQGRQNLINQLPDVARDAETQADRVQIQSDAFIANLARDAYRARTGYEPSFPSDASAADYFRALPQQEQERYTRGVPLPDPSGAQANARRLRGLAESPNPIQFNQNAPIEQVGLDPVLAGRERGRQELEFFAQQTANEAASREIGRQGLASRRTLLEEETANRQAEINLGNLDQTDRVVDAEARAAEADAEQRRVRSNVVREIDEATTQEQIATAKAKLSPADKKDLEALPKTAVPDEILVQTEFGLSDSLAEIRGKTDSDQSRASLQSAQNVLRYVQANRDMTADEKAAWAKRNLRRIQQTAMTDGRSIDDPGIKKGFFERGVAGFVGDVLNPPAGGATGAAADLLTLYTNPGRLFTRRPNAEKREEGDGELQSQYAALIRDLRTMAGVDE